MARGKVADGLDRGSRFAIPAGYADAKRMGGAAPHSIVESRSRHLHHDRFHHGHAAVAICKRPRILPWHGLCDQRALGSWGLVVSVHAESRRRQSVSIGPPNVQRLEHTVHA